MSEQNVPETSENTPSENMTRRALLRRAALAAGGAAGLTLAPAAQARGRHAPPPAPAAGPPASEAAPPSGPDVPAPGRSIEDVVKGFEKLDGPLTLYRRRNDLYAEVRPDQLDRPFLLQATRATGTAGPDGTVGEPLGDIVFLFRKMNDRIYLVEPNLLFRAREKSPEAVSLDRSFAEGYLASFPIVATRPDPAQAKAIAAADPQAKQDLQEKTAKSFLIHVPSLFLADAPDFLRALPGYKIDADRTFLKSVRGFAGNVSVVTEYALTGRGADSPLLPDARSLPQEVAYTLFPLADDGYRPRFYDDRIGYFTEDYQTFDEDTAPDNARRMILRWHLAKKDPQAASSEPVTPITFWVDNATPLRYRDAIREGVLLWNAAFEPLGYKDAVRCEVMPDDAAWDPADMSHNVVRWMSSPDAGYAVAQFRHNPLTGEIVNAAISVDASMARFNNLSYPTTLFNGLPAEGGDTALTPAQVADLIVNAGPEAQPASRCQCRLGPGALQCAAFGWDSLALSGDGGPDALTLPEYTHQYLRMVVSHEMGHCLGLRHNFKASTMLTPAQLQDRAVTSKFGVAGSVMDYLPANLPPLGGKRADLFMPCVGPYDKWAIAYGYAQFADPAHEASGLRAIAARSHEFGHAYASDENADSVDPTITRFDLGADPLADRVLRVERAHRLLETVEYHYPDAGQSYYDLTRVFLRALGGYSSNALAVSRFVGGVVTSRSHPGDPGAGLPVQPVPAADQRRALQVLCRYVLSDGALQFSPSLLAKLEQDPAPFSPLTTTPPRQDLSVLDSVSFTQAVCLSTVLNAATLGRIETNEFRAGAGRAALSVLEAMDTLTGAIWSELDGHAHALRPLRRRLQRTHVDVLTELARQPSSGDAGAFARATLRGLVPRLTAAGAATHDPSTAAHLAETHDRIVRFLHAETVV